MFHRWFTGPTNAVADNNPTPYKVDWNWLMKYPEVQSKYSAFVQEKVMNDKAKKSLGGILQREGFLTDEPTTFDFTTSPQSDWEKNYHTQQSVPRGNSVNGLLAAMAGFTLRALPGGTITPLPDGKYRICVTKMSVFAHDQFNFAGEEWLGAWNSDEGTFSLDPTSGPEVYNSDFRNFRDRHGLGNNFLVLSDAHPVEDFEGECYVYP